MSKYKIVIYMCRNFAVIYVTIGLDASSAFEKIVPSIVFWFFLSWKLVNFLQKLVFLSQILTDSNNVSQCQRKWVFRVIYVTMFLDCCT